MAQTAEIGEEQKEHVGAMAGASHDCGGAQSPRASHASLPLTGNTGAASEQKQRKAEGRHAERGPGSTDLGLRGVEHCTVDPSRWRSL